MALSILQETFGADLAECGDLAVLGEFSNQERRVLDGMMERGLRSPRTSSAGRLFDAVASIIGLRQVCRFEGQAMELEFLTDDVESMVYEFDLNADADGQVSRLGENGACRLRRLRDGVSRRHHRGEVSQHAGGDDGSSCTELR